MSHIHHKHSMCKKWTAQANISPFQKQNRLHTKKSLSSFNTLRHASVSAEVQSKFTARHFLARSLLKIILSKMVHIVGENLLWAADRCYLSFIYLHQTSHRRWSHGHRKLALISTEQGHFSTSKHYSHRCIGEITQTDCPALACSLV